MSGERIQTLRMCCILWLGSIHLLCRHLDILLLSLVFRESSERLVTSALPLLPNKTHFESILLGTPCNKSLCAGHGRQFMIFHNSGSPGPIDIAVLTQFNSGFLSFGRLVALPFFDWRPLKMTENALLFMSHCGNVVRGDPSVEGRIFHLKNTGNDQTPRCMQHRMT